jgi:hypothetical protein
VNSRHALLDFLHAGLPWVSLVTHQKRTMIGTSAAAIGLARLMERSSGRPEISIGLIDGPVALSG